MATISSSENKRSRIHSSSQIRNALAYIVITALALLFLNLYSATTSRNLMFSAKYTSMQDKIQVVSSSFSGADSLTSETARQIISVLGDLNVARTIVTDQQGRVLYDSSQNQNAEGKFALFDEIMQALTGRDVFRCTYQSGVLHSYSAVPIMTHETVAGCVYMAEYDAEQGRILQNLERNILRGSIVLLAVIFFCAVLFALAGSRRMSKVLTNMRLVREGEYSHKIEMRGNDEYTKLATEFNKLTDRLQQSEQVQRQFISDASHELKTPLASIKLLSDSILQNPMDAGTMREFVADIGSESDRLTRMTQKLLTLSRSEDLTPEHIIVDLGQMVSRVYRMLVPLADRSDVELTAQVSGACTILSFEDDAYQIVFNLVENAIKYNHPGGTVHVTVEGGEDDVRLEVRDTGVGIPQSAIDHIFERFYRVDKARSRQAGGSGLGLSIARELVERNMGVISVSSEEGKGTCFSVIFPYIGTGEEDSDAQ